MKIKILATGLFAAFLVGLLMLRAAPPSPAPRADTPAVAEPVLDHTDWHAVSATTEVKWINDDAFSHVGGHCYGRARDGSTRTSSGAPGLAPIAEKYCIAAGAKDTPFDVPDKR